MLLVQEVDYEGELAIVIGKQLKDASTAEAAQGILLPFDKLLQCRNRPNPGNTNNHEQTEHSKVISLKPKMSDLQDV
eukprot:114659-Amphidinium_carterae.1